MHFGATLRLFRVERGLGLRELARRIGVSGSYLSRVENGHDPPPSPERLATLADALGISRPLLVELAGQLGPAAAGYMHRVPAAASLLLDLAKRDLGSGAIARLRAFLDQEYPDAGAGRRTPRCTDLLSAERIVLGLRCTDFDDVLSTLVARLPLLPGLIGKDVLQSVRQREEGAPSLLGGGFALPHASVSVGGSFQGLATLAILAQPLAAATPDGQPLRWAALVVCARGEQDGSLTASAELVLLASFARLAAVVDLGEIQQLGSEAEVHRRLVELECMF